MTDRPILFSGPMVRALLQGRKTQTRRLINFPGAEKVMDFVKVATDNEGRPVYEMKDATGQFLTRPASKGFVDYHFSPRIGVGDRLWVKENAAVRFQSWHHVDGDTHQVSYRADEDDHGRWLGLPACGSGIRRGKAPSVFPSKSHNLNGSLRWQPSIHMPKWASRLTLVVTDVRVERLQDISEADAIAEGAELSQHPGMDGGVMVKTDVPGVTASPGVWYRWLWDEINGKGAWKANPWIVAYSFSVIRQNIDQIEREAA